MYVNCVKVTQLCPTLCDPMEYKSVEFSRPEYWSGLLFPSPRDLPNPGIEPRSAALQADSLPAGSPGKPRILEWVAYPFSRGSSQPWNQTVVSCTAGRFFASSATREAPTVFIPPRSTFSQSTYNLLIDLKMQYTW